MLDDRIIKESSHSRDADRWFKVVIIVYAVIEAVSIAVVLFLWVTNQT